MRILTFFLKSNEPAGRETLRRAVRATRRTAAADVLTVSARDRILDATRNQTDQPVELFPSLFTAPRKLLLAGTLPLILAVGMLVLLNQPAPVAPTLSDPSLQVSKKDGQVFLRIANGSRDHVVSRSTVPHRFERSSSVTVNDGSYTEALDDQADLIFYRID